MSDQREIIEGKTFGPSERVRLDDRHFIRCTFNGSTLTFAGGELPLMKDCTLNGASFDFEGQADKTIQFLRWLKLSGGQNVIDAFLTMNPKKMH